MLGALDIPTVTDDDGDAFLTPFPPWGHCQGIPISTVDVDTFPITLFFEVSFNWYEHKPWLFQRFLLASAMCQSRDVASWGHDRLRLRTKFQHVEDMAMCDGSLFKRPWRLAVPRCDRQSRGHRFIQSKGNPVCLCGCHLG